MKFGALRSENIGSASGCWDATHGDMDTSGSTMALVGCGLLSSALAHLGPLTSIFLRETHDTCLIMGKHVCSENVAEY